MRRNGAAWAAEPLPDPFPLWEAGSIGFFIAPCPIAPMPFPAKDMVGEIAPREQEPPEGRFRLVLLRRLFGLVALGPFREDALAVFSHPGEVVFHHALFGIRRIILRDVLHVRMRHGSIGLGIELVRRL